MGHRTPLAAVMVVPPVFDFYFTPHRATALGARIVEGLLRSAGCSVELLDFPSRLPRGQTIALPDSLSYMRPFVLPNETGELSFFTHYRRFGPPVDRCADEICGRSPDLVLISCWAYCHAGTVVELAREIKRRHPSAVLVVGGAGVSARPEFFAREESIDVACAGEAELAIPALLRTLTRGGIPGDIPDAWQHGQPPRPGVRRFTEGNEMTPGMAVTRGRRGEWRITASLSRGCPRRCRFCSSVLSHGRSFRAVPLPRVQESVALLQIPEPPACVSVNFEDDNLLSDPAYFFAAVKIFQQRFGNPSLYMENGIDYLLLDPDLVRRLARLGMRQLNLSLGSLSETSAGGERRVLDMARYEAVVRTAAEEGLTCITYFICGLEGDTPEAIGRGLAGLAALPTRVGISLFYLVPGLDGVGDPHRMERLPPLVSAGSSAFPWTGSLSTSGLVTAFRLSRYVNACRLPASNDRLQALLERVRRERRVYTLVRSGAGVHATPVEGMDQEMVSAFFDHLGRAERA